jgi:hypothetical protein
MMKFFSVIILLISLTGLACSKGSDPHTNNNGVDCSTIAKSFSANVMPLVSSRCAISGCHASGSTNGPGELITYQEIFNARGNIRSAVSSGLMPQGSTLTQSQINTILCWIDSGAPNN